MRILISLCVVGLFPVSGFADTAVISPSGGESLIKTIDTIAKMGMQNGDEYIFHLCKLAQKRLVTEDQREKIGDFLAMVEPRINARDRKVEENLARKKFSAIYQNEYRAARYLYRLTAAALLASLTKEDAEQKLPQNLENVVRRLFPEIVREDSDYRIKWTEVILGEQFELEATPFHYEKSGIRSFLLIYSNGFIFFYGGDFSGGRVELGHERAKKVHLNDFL